LTPSLHLDQPTNCSITAPSTFPNFDRAAFETFLTSNNTVSNITLDGVFTLGTLDGWVMRVGELLRPISGAMALELLAGNYIQADEKPVGVQSERVRGKNHQAYLWPYSRLGGAVVFDFRLGREREGPKRFLGNFEGILQSDGYAACDHVGGPKIVHTSLLGTCQAQVLPSGGTQSKRPDNH
jgi:transposase IS66 family protein